MKYFKIILIALLSLGATQSIAQYSSNQESDIDEYGMIFMKDYLKSYMEIIGTELYAREMGDIPSGEFAESSTEELACLYECLGVLDYRLVEFISNIELLDILYEEGDDRDDAKEREQKALDNFLNDDDNCKCMKEETENEHYYLKAE